MLKEQWDLFKHAEEQQKLGFVPQKEHNKVNMHVSEDIRRDESPKHRNKKRKSPKKDKKDIVLRIDNEMQQIKCLKKFKRELSNENLEHENNRYSSYTYSSITQSMKDSSKKLPKNHKKILSH